MLAAPAHLHLSSAICRFQAPKCNNFSRGFSKQTSEWALTKECRRQPRSSSAIACASSTSLAESSPAPVVQSVKQFLEDLKGAGRLRIIVNTGVGVLESVTTLDKLFFSNVPGKGEYANVMSKEDNVDFHLLVDKVASAKLVEGKSMRGDIPTYMIRFFDQAGSNVASLLLMWKPDTDGEYDDAQIPAFKALLNKYGLQVTFIA